MNDTLGFAIVGTGLIADFHARAVAGARGGRLLAVCSRDLERAKAFGSRYDCDAYGNLDALLARPDIDVLLIATPSGMHMEAAIAAARAGKHVLCEKPLEISLERIDTMIAEHEKAGTRLGCIFQMRYMPVLSSIRQLLRDGMLGTLTYAGAYVPWWRSDEYYAGSSWHGTAKLDGGGALINQSIHMIDILCDLMPAVRQVVGCVSNAGHPHIETEAAAAASLLFEGGAVGVIYGSTSAWPGQSKRLEISGTRGGLVLEDEVLTFLRLADAPDGTEQRIMAEFGRKESAVPSGVSNPGAMSHALHQRCFEDFMQAVSGGKEFGSDGSSARRPVAVIDAIYRSAREGRMIAL